MIRRWLRRLQSKLTDLMNRWISHGHANGDDRAMKPEHLAELERLLLNADGFASGIVSPLEEVTDEKRIALGLCVSLREVYRAIYFLLRERLAEEARMLWRTLLDDASLLMWMVAHEDSLDEISLRFYFSEADPGRHCSAARDRLPTTRVREDEASQWESPMENHPS